MSAQPGTEAVRAPDVWGESARSRVRQVLFDVTIAAGFGAVTIAVHLQQGPWAALAAGLLAAAVAVRRLWWPVMVALAGAAGVVQVADSTVVVLADLAYALVAFTLGAHTSPLVRRVGLASVCAVALGAGGWTAADTMLRGNPAAAAVAGAGMAALAAVVTGGGWVAGYLRWQRRQAVQSSVEAGLQAAERRRLHGLVDQERERARIAADMHDVVAHSWAVVAAQADGARYVLRTDPERAEAALVLIGDTARTAMGEVRGLLTELRRGAAEAAEAEPEPVEALLSRMRAAGMEIDLRADVGPSIEDQPGGAARRVLGEALTNALKHGDLSHPVLVELDSTHGYRLRVVNALPPRAPATGPGATIPGATTPGAEAAVAAGSGHGLRGMAERVAISGGSFSAGPDGGHWVLVARLPADADGGAQR